MKNETRELMHAIWMLSSAVQNMTCAINAIEREDEKMTEEWLTAAIDCMSEAEKAIENTKLIQW